MIRACLLQGPRPGFTDSGQETVRECGWGATERRLDALIGSSQCGIVAMSGCWRNVAL